MFPTLQSERLLLRQINSSDIDNIFKGLSTPIVTDYYGLSYETLEETQEQMDRYAYLEKSGTGNWWAVCFAANEAFIGAIGFTKFSPENRSGELAYWLLPEYWGVGLMSEALEMVCQHGFNKFGLRVIQARIESENERSKKLLLQSGFQYENTLKDCEFKDGVYISYDLFAKENGNA